ncbi:hypothetical protein Pan181_28980 [Aeoliella mucimassa]|uniref:Uncharacterized protein n=1 Tax=Aeoliella mucimassa TaxID=2527972 RepID=A0A518APP4_9BACT|nr:hypothetical protein Pan181_28980 [Aeoliella mucimassa]
MAAFLSYTKLVQYALCNTNGLTLLTCGSLLAGLGCGGSIDEATAGLTAGKSPSANENAFYRDSSCPLKQPSPEGRLARQGSKYELSLADGKHVLFFSIDHISIIQPMGLEPSPSGETFRFIYYLDG